jgi:hypothetical protein
MNRIMGARRLRRAPVQGSMREFFRAILNLRHSRQLRAAKALPKASGRNSPQPRASAAVFRRLPDVSTAAYSVGQKSAATLEDIRAWQPSELALQEPKAAYSRGRGVISDRRCDAGQVLAIMD